MAYDINKLLVPATSPLGPITERAEELRFTSVCEAHVVTQKAFLVNQFLEENAGSMVHLDILYSVVLRSFLTDYTKVIRQVAPERYSPEEELKIAIHETLRVISTTYNAVKGYRE